VAVAQVELRFRLVCGFGSAFGYLLRRIFGVPKSSKVIQSPKNLDLTGRYRENIPLIFVISRVCLDSNRVGGDRPRVGRIFKGDPTDPG
jgi:hypothetical protein